MADKQTKLVVTPIEDNDTKFVDICNAVFVSIKNQGMSAVEYSTGGGRVTLLPNEEDPFPSCVHPINTKIKFYYPDTTDIKIKVKQIVLI